MGAQSSKRPFWMHQLVEYILGIGLIAAGTQSPTPAVPAITGGIIVLWAACTKSSMAAFRVLPRSAHRWGDPVVILLVVVAATQPWSDVDFASRGVMLLIAFVYAFVWWQTSYSERSKARPAAAPTPAASPDDAATGTTAGSTAGDRSTDLGRSAGRAVGSGVRAWRRAKAKLEDS